MILPDNTPDSPTKSRAGPPSALSEETHEDRLPPPPAYPGHPYQYRSVDIEAQAGTSTSRTSLRQRPGPPPVHHIEAFEPPLRRFLKAFGVAVLIYIVLASFTRTVVAGIHWETGRRDVQFPLPRTSDGRPISCSSASHRNVIVSASNAMPVTTFLVPLSADLLHIWGRGALSHGTINFRPSTDRSIPEGSVRVDITPRDYSTEALQSVNICLLEPAANQRSIGILTPKKWWSTEKINFTVDVFFPVSPWKSAPLHVKAIETNLPLFTHVFSKLEGKVAFDSLKAYSSNMPIHGDYVDVESAKIVTSNARIDGKFRVSRSLELQTSNQHIDTEVVLDYDALSQGDASTNLTLHNSNGLIHSKISLRTASPFGIGGFYAVSASTQNGAVDLSFPEQPVDSTLTLSARTSNSPAMVRLNPAFEGQFELGTANGPVTFAPDKNVADPAHRGRTRSWMLSERTMRAWRGLVTWGFPNDPDRNLKGWARVETLNDMVELRV
ncbi:hypothetical protein GSI_04423 [Ganoderma sinense ZZ0214-1]|uniref:DUF7330 domain-containing protein n=1 Tax=Ganoderma sinense ZZ0214-1 TaxID=1077348 RepID=A0A2G8SJS7_9APHY|nr:hypothetical protein GSI_04423 [Ganoderma sinense ZZ0214-1]